MQQKKNISLGFRGWMLVLFQAIAFLTFVISTNWPLNMLTEVMPDVYGTADALVPLYTIGMLVGIVFQLVLNPFIGRIKSVKNMVLVFGVITMVAWLGIMLLQGGALWMVAYFVACVFSTMYACFAIGILVGQWFPRRKGTIMGIATFAFPISNGLLGAFAGLIFRKGYPDVFGAFLPFFILGIVGLVIGAIFIKDYPEQVGAYRDNDKSLTPEIAKAMMEQEIENKKTSVWKLGPVLKSPDFWFVTIPMGALLMCSVGMMTQTAAIIGNYPKLPFEGIMVMIMLVACFGSWLLGVLDTKFGTKLAILISVLVMLLAGIFGAIGSTVTMVIALVLLAIFMGAASNFTVSAAAQYWRREDFPSVFAVVNPIANILQCIGPMMVAMTLNAVGIHMPFIITAVLAAICFVLILCFKPARVKSTDDKYRTAAGKPLDDALVGRK